MDNKTINEKINSNKSEIKALRLENKSLLELIKQNREEKRIESYSSKLRNLFFEMKNQISELKKKSPQEIKEFNEKIDIDNKKTFDCIDEILNNNSNTSKSVYLKELKDLELPDEEPSSEEVEKTKLRFKILNIVNDPTNISRWVVTSKYKQLNLDSDEFICPVCGEYLSIRVWDEGQVILTCAKGFNKTGCNYGFFVRSNKPKRRF